MPPFITLKELSMDYSNSDDNQTLYTQYNEVDIPGVILVVTASDTGQQRPNQILGYPAEVFTTTVSNVLECSVTDKLTKYGTLSTVGLKKRYSKGGRGWLPVGVANSEFSQGSSICDFSCCSPENPYTLYLKMLGILSSSKINVTKKVGF